MRRFILLPLLLALLFGGCSDIVGLGGRSADGDWRATFGGEEVRVTLRDRAGDIRGDGRWGRDDVFVSGDRRGSDLSLRFEFALYSPIDFEGTIRSGQLEGRLYGSGLNGDLVRFHRF